MLAVWLSDSESDDDKNEFARYTTELVVTARVITAGCVRACVREWLSVFC
jgi:hypothetical protein